MKNKILKELENEELEILEALESGEYNPVEDVEKNQFKAIVQDNLSKRKVINIRPLAVDIIKIKTKAIAKGIPYQTLISSIIHQFANDKLIENS